MRIFIIVILLVISLIVCAITVFDNYLVKRNCMNYGESTNREVKMGGDFFNYRCYVKVKNEWWLLEQVRTTNDQ